MSTTSDNTGQAAGPGLACLPPGIDAEGIGLALDAMEIGVFEWDATTLVHRFCGRCRRIWGFAATDEMTFDAMCSRIHPDDRPLADLARAAISPGGSGRYSFEHRIVLPADGIRWVAVCGGLGPAGAGQARRGCGMMRDVTARRVTVQQRYERSSQLKACLECAPAPVVILDRQMRALAVSRRHAQKRKLDAGRMIGRSVNELCPGMSPHWCAAQQRVLSQGTTEHCENDPYVRPDGRHEWLRWEMRPWHRADNEIGGLVLFSEVITHRLRAQQELRDSQAHLELAVRAGALGIFDYDFIGQKVDWDGRVRELWGFSPDETITYDVFMQGIHPDDRHKVTRATDASAENRLIALEYRLLRGHEAPRWVAATGRMYYKEGRPVRCVGVIQDITERKRTELELAESAQRLRLADERKNVYLATLSHELRNPLAPIRTAAHILASPSLSEEQIRWASEVIGRQTAHMVLILDDLLEITRIVRGRLVLKKEHVPLATITQSAIESARPMIDEKHHRLLVRLPAQSLQVHADPVRLSQVLSNLLTNAAKYTEPGGRIELSVTALGTLLTLRVRDNGIGIARDQLDKIFTLFWQAESRPGQLQSGLGIGLAFVKGIVGLHEGTIEALSDGPGHGSELIVRLPVVEPTMAAAPA